MMYLESAEIHTPVIELLWALSIDLNRFPSMFQILIDLSSDPLMMYLESAEIHTPVTELSWALSIDLIRFPSMFQILIDL
jgi:hypothetical protein